METTAAPAPGHGWRELREKEKGRGCKEVLERSPDWEKDGEISKSTKIELNRSIDKVREERTRSGERMKIKTKKEHFHKKVRTAQFFLEHFEVLSIVGSHVRKYTTKIPSEHITCGLRSLSGMPPWLQLPQTAVTC